MTELEAKDILERNWWKTFGGKGPEGVLMAVGDLYEEDEGNYWFYATRYPLGLSSARRTTLSGIEIRKSATTGCTNRLES